MQRTIIVLVLLIAGLGIYLFSQRSATLIEAQPQQSLEPSTSAVPPTVVEAAKQHIEKLTNDSKEQVLDITKADNFVTGEQLLKMPTMESETIRVEQVNPPQATIDAAQANETVQSESLVSQAQNQVQAQAQAQATNPVAPAEDRAPGSASASTINPGVTDLVVTQAVDTGSTMIQGAASAIERQSVVVTQGAEPAVSFESGDNTSNSVEMSTTQTGQSLRPGQRIRLQELLSDPDLAAGTVFYIHAVSPTDAQGLWGILQRGLIKTFAQGIELKESGRRLSAEIPLLADETLENRRSSFLGEFLYQKVQDTYVYNYQQGMLGQDPDLIKPGQQLIIVSYTEDELISIFNHFTRPGA